MTRWTPLAGLVAAWAAVLLVLGALAAPGGAAAGVLPVLGAGTGAAPGAPGETAHWTTGAKQGIGTSAGTRSKVWHTLADGAMTEVYYPRVDVANVRLLQVVVTDGETFTDLEQDATTHRVVLLNSRSLTYRQVNTDRDGRYRVVKTYVTDPASDTVMVRVRVRSLDGGRYTSYILYDPSLANSGLHDSGGSVGSRNQRLVASDTTGETPISSALVARPAFRATSTGYAGASDGWSDLAGDHQLDWRYASAGDGNVVQVGQLAEPRHGTTKATVALSFGADEQTALDTARASLQRRFKAVWAQYRLGWSNYLSGLAQPPASVREDKRLLTQYRVALMTLRACEDKTYRGAGIASLTIPWGQAQDADEAGVGGYHLVWARDLYQVATAQLAAGDAAAARRSLHYLFTVQQKPDGSFPQNSLLDGTPYWGSLQLDEVALPIVLAHQLGAFGPRTWGHVRAAADFLVANGPATPQERWEEEGGYSPSTIAAQIAGLIAAADIADRNDDYKRYVLYTAVADDWQAKLKQWTFTRTGPLGNGRYFMRVNADTDPDDGDPLEINNGGGTYDEREIVDAGFLELVRLGILPADDPQVLGSLPEVDATIRVRTPHGPMWYRYNHDGYGEHVDGSPYDGTGVGRLWPLLSGERGEYALTAGQDATRYLHTMAGAANQGYLIPEQVWDQPTTDSSAAVGLRFGEGTGSATPLAWSMAQFVRLAHSIDVGRPVEQPRVVTDHYYEGRGDPDFRVTLTSPTPGEVTTKRSIRIEGKVIAGTTEGTSAVVSVNGRTKYVNVRFLGRFSTTVRLQPGPNSILVAVKDTDLRTVLVQRTVVSTYAGEPVGAISDPSGDDTGPGTYVHPANDAFVDGAFDLTGLRVAEEETSVNVVVRIAGELTNPWGGDQLSVQRFDLYLRAGDSATGGPVPARPGTNADLAAPYDLVLTADGFSGAELRNGVGEVVAGATLKAIPQTRELIVSVPRQAFGSMDLAGAEVALTSMSHAADDEGLGGIRPVYDRDYWQSTAGTELSWIHDYRFGGGAGVWTDNAAKDTDTRDPNVLDILTPEGTEQSSVLDWTAQAPVVLPYVELR